MKSNYAAQARVHKLLICDKSHHVHSITFLVVGNIPSSFSRDSLISLCKARNRSPRFGLSCETTVECMIRSEVDRCL